MIDRIGPLIVVALLGPAAAGQCLVANPSFEVGRGLDGWNWFNSVSIDAGAALHGNNEVAIAGPNSNAWGISAVWQPFDAAAGDQFTARVRAGHRAADPLTGQAAAILNIEWRDATDTLIDFESHTLVSPGDPTGEMRTHEITSAPAPAGAVSTRLLLATLQSPANDPGTAYFDLAEFIQVTVPTYDQEQWGDFPGGRRIDFAGHAWRVKGPGIYGPGPNYFDDNIDNVWVDDDGLHMTIRDNGASWDSTEIVLEEALGYGDYIFTTKGQLDLLADNVILGLFLWQYPPCYDPANFWNQHNEIDVEISRWGQPGNDVAQFVVQPWDFPGNIERFDITYAPDEVVSYAMRWLPDRIEYRAWRGGPTDESPATMLHEWTYAGPHIARPEQPRVHINLWHLDTGPVNGLDQEVVMPTFVFTPACGFGDPTIEELYEVNETPVDLNLDGVADDADAACLQRHLRSDEVVDTSR
ncbi:MAG: hypothetical protein AAFX05_03690 [Planctomycetota bacterium]